MIISHKYKYIFIKPTKVASTSLEVALGKFRGESDIITPISDFNSNLDDDEYDHRPQNYEGYFNHIAPQAIKANIGEEIWNSYFKFTIVRNPWDMVISRYWWEDPLGERIKNGEVVSDEVKQEVFKTFVENFNPVWTNQGYYFDENGNRHCDFYMRYERLDEDFAEVCKRIGIPKVDLPKLKSKVRKDKKPYQEYYDDYTKAIVEQKFAKTLEEFGYQF